MFGLFKKEVHSKELLDVMAIQTDALKGLLSLYLSLAERFPEKADGEIPDLGLVLDKICGDWYSKKQGICLTIRKYGDDYFAEIRDTGHLPEDFVENYPVRLHKNMIYFVLEGYAIFLEYNAEIHELNLCGKLSLLRKAADASLFPNLPFNLNPDRSF